MTQQANGILRSPPKKERRYSSIDSIVFGQSLLGIDGRRVTSRGLVGGIELTEFTNRPDDRKKIEVRDIDLKAHPFLMAKIKRQEL